jgi:septum formation topological specificity factor MinE
MGLFDFFKKATPAAADPALEQRVQELIAQLRESAPQRRMDAAEELRKLGIKAASAQVALEEATCDENNEVCTVAAEALTTIRRALDAAGR